MNRAERERTIENIARLRRVERTSPSPELAQVREDLEAQLGGTVPRSLSARVLGVSHTALNNWIESGDVPAVITRQGRKEIPIPVLLGLQEEVSRQRRSGRRKLHLLEPIMLDAKRRAAQRRPRPESSCSSRSDSHRTADLRALVYHCALAPRLRRPMVDEAHRKLARWQEEEKIDPRHAEAWEKVFALSMSQIRKAITADDEQGRDLRQNSPLAGLLSEPERRRILERI